ncbi:TIGR02680 family protein [Kitasatospora sp. NPDC093806]|uniref:TIGR02680 family protein n=1 Tax=Kitasatospora sp. NPDC093806 TaxID=3155075 RepID=UPI00342A72B3
MNVTELPARTAEPDTETFDRTARWQPTRAGILNVWRYFDETFTFHDGRLLLRGHNGTGKSKALEVLLPFLFDANLRPNRLSTFGGSERTMHWNLMGEGASGKTRIGYVWVEFRTVRGGQPRWFTCGARLQASVHTAGVTADYFTTTLRVSRPGGLDLVNGAGQPLTKAALAEALRGDGEVHGAAADYRTAVRTTLFPGLSEQRYDALITALLQLRTPKLSERLDPALLSSLLSRALPPLGEGEITELAEGFERLDRQREHLRSLDEEVAAADAVASQQRGYARRVLRAGAAALISATTEMDNLTRVVRESEQDHATALDRRTEVEIARTAAEHTGQEVEGAIQGLLDSEVYREGQEIDQLRRRADQAQRVARNLRESAEVKRRAAETEQDGAESVRRQVEHHLAHVRAAEEDSRAAARRAAMESVCGEARRLLDGPAEPPSVALRPTVVAAPATEVAGRVRGARVLFRGAVSVRQEQIGQVRSALGRHEQARTDRQTAEGHLEQARERLSDATGRLDEAVRAHDTALDEQAGRLRQWAVDECTELVIDDPEELAARAATETAVLDLVNSAARKVEKTLTALETTATADREAALEYRQRISDELARTAAETELVPAAPAFRTSDRADLPGAPLWRLVAFRAEAAAAEQAGVEAALEAAGLLDAWVTPDGAVTAPGHDTYALPGLADAVSGSSLLDVLRPESDAPVPAGVIRRLLAGVAYGPHLPADHPVAVAADGAWRLAPLTGTWSKHEACYLGAAARERARQRRIAELTVRLAEAETAAETHEQVLRALTERRDRLAADLRARPGHQALAEATRTRERAESDLGTREEAVRDAVTRLADRETAVARAQRALAGISAEYGLPTDRVALDRVAAAVTALREQADIWLDGHLDWATAHSAWGLAQRHADSVRAAALESSEAATGAEAEARGLAATLEAVESSVGEDYRQLAARLDDLRLTQARSRREAADLTAELITLEGRIGALRTTMTQDVEQYERSVESRDAAARRFRHLCVLGLPEDAGRAVALTGEDGTRATLDAARDVAAAWPSIPHSARNLGDSLNRLSEAVHRARQSLGGRADVELEADEDIHLLTASVDGIRTGAAGLLAMLTEDRKRSSDDITAAERDLFERTLTGDTRRHLASRIRQATDLVDRMNGHLARVRTASKVAVRLVWQIHPDLPPGTRAARELLLKDPARITEADREALFAFFRGRIDEAKVKNTAATWEEQLAEVLDYTAWHQFVVKLDRGNGASWQLLTKKLHGALSGGEKAIALHLPLFAAVAAHYEAVAAAPRLILLDEVFVGVDSTNRGQVFGLLAGLDLDLLLTSDHEWCSYQELPGIAVHQLIAGSDGDDAVTSARFVWTGADLIPDEGEPVPGRTDQESTLS